LEGEHDDVPLFVFKKQTVMAVKSSSKKLDGDNVDSVRG
jgi:hypothetical protein